jgi:hypothetical protein
MKVPLILITYGFSQKLLTWEEEGVHKLPFFGEPVLASLFLTKFKEHMGPMLEDKEPPQVQVCDNPRHGLDMLRLIGIIDPSIIIVYNPPPIGEDPQEAIGKVANQFQDMATVINKHFDLEEATAVFQSMVDELDEESESKDSDSDDSEE